MLPPKFQGNLKLDTKKSVEICRFLKVALLTLFSYPKARTRSSTNYFSSQLNRIMLGRNVLSIEGLTFILSMLLPLQCIINNMNFTLSTILYIVSVHKNDRCCFWIWTERSNRGSIGLVCVLIKYTASLPAFISRHQVYRNHSTTFTHYRMYSKYWVMNLLKYGWADLSHRVKSLTLPLSVTCVVYIV